MSATVPTLDVAGAIAAMGLCYFECYEGGWVDLPGLPGVRAKVRGFDSPTYRLTLLRRQQIPIRLTEEDVFAELIGDAILVDIDGVEDEDGEPLKVGHVRALLGQKPYRALREAIVDAAAAMAKGRACDRSSPCPICPKAPPCP